MGTDFDVVVRMHNGLDKIVKMSREEYFKMFEFDHVFENKGGYYHTHQLPDPAYLTNPINGIIRLIGEIRKSNPNFPSPVVGIIGDPKLGASTGKHGNQYFIGINVGTFFLLDDLFNRMLSSQNILKEYGDPLLEGPTSKINFVAITDVNDLIKEKEPNECVWPRDRTRLHLARLLTAMVIKSMAMHEYAHIIFGHVDYQIDLLRNNSSVTPLDNQSLEYDADCYACKMAFAEMTPLVGNADLKEELVPFYQNLESTIFLWAFAIYSGYRLYQTQPVNENTLQEKYYPHVGIRQRTMFSMLHPLLEMGNFNDVIPKITTIASSVIQQVERAFEEISNQGYCDGNIRFALSPRANEHVELVHNNWVHVRNALEKFAYGKLAPAERLGN